MDREVFLWLVSTAPQVLAALIGLSFAAMTFRTSAIESLISKDDSLLEIEGEVKRLIFNGFKLVLVLGVLVIGIDLGYVASAGRIDFSSSLSCALVYVFLFFNAAGLLSICLFMITVGDPEYHKVAAKNLMKSYRPGTVSSSEFVMHFRDLEVALRALYPQNGQQRYLTVRDMLRLLASDGRISKNEYYELLNINRLRNLIVHGDEIDKVEQDLDDKLKGFTNKVEGFVQKD